MTFRERDILNLCSKWMGEFVWELSKEDYTEEEYILIFNNIINRCSFQVENLTKRLIEK